MAAGGGGLIVVKSTSFVAGLVGDSARQRCGCVEQGAVLSAGRNPNGRLDLSAADQIR